MWSPVQSTICNTVHYKDNCNSIHSAEGRSRTYVDDYPKTVQITRICKGYTHTVIKEATKALYMYLCILKKLIQGCCICVCSIRINVQNIQAVILLVATIEDALHNHTISLTMHILYRYT